MMLSGLNSTAPEVLIGGPHSEASDVYAFGVLIFEVYTFGARLFSKRLARSGRPPLREASNQDVQLLTRRPDDPFEAITLRSADLICFPSLAGLARHVQIVVVMVGRERLGC